MQQKLVIKPQKKKTLSQYEIMNKNTQKMCINHKDKQVTVFIQGLYQCIPSNEAIRANYIQNYYCANCTIQYSTKKNFQIIEVQTGEVISEYQRSKTPNKEISQMKVETMSNLDKEKRSKIIYKMIDSQNLLLYDSQHVQQQIHLKQQQIKFDYEQQIINLDVTYNQIKQLVDQVKCQKEFHIKNLQKAQNFNSRATKQFENQIASLNSQIENINCIMKDYGDNTEVIYKITDNQFKDLVEQWQLKLKSFQKNNRDVEQTKIITESFRGKKESQPYVQDLQNKIEIIFQLKKSTQNISESGNMKENLQVFTPIQRDNQHQQRKSEVPKQAININNMDEIKNFQEILRNAKKNSQGDVSLSPMSKKDTRHQSRQDFQETRQEPSQSIWFEKENHSYNSNNPRSLTPTNKKQSMLSPQHKLDHSKIIQTPSNKDLLGLYKKNQN